MLGMLPRSTLKSVRRTGQLLSRKRSAISFDSQIDLVRVDDDQRKVLQGYRGGAAKGTSVKNVIKKKK